VLMHNGRVEQIGTPEAVYDTPATLFVAGFVGASAMNLVPGRVEKDGAECSVVLGPGVRLRLPAGRFDPHAGAAVTVGLRPEHLQWCPKPGAAPGAELTLGPSMALEGVARIVEPLGSDTLTVFEVNGVANSGVAIGGVACELQARLPPRTVRRAGDPVRVTITPESIHLFNPSTQRRL
jgi:ABC-type sugar transport system ATPase subunit